MKLCDTIIKYAFYTLFILTPLTFSGSTSELFELNKMWLTYGIATIIISAWAIKMIHQKAFVVQRTPLDIPLMLFLLSQIVATLFSLDSYVSFWGYYSRFNGGLLSTMVYILLYYAFVSNFTTILSVVKKMLFLALVSGTLVMLWGFPSHFGYDPTCFVFRGTLDTACWTDAFKPTIRTFSTLGQPAWFAAYLAFLIPLAIVFIWKDASLMAHNTKKKQLPTFLTKKRFWAYGGLALLFYLSLIFADTRAGLLGFIAADILLWAVLFIKKCFSKRLFITYAVLFHMTFLFSHFFFGIPVNALQKFTLPHLNKEQVTQQAQPQTTEATPDAVTTQPVEANIITDSGNIRLHVWEGSFAAWKANPLFGTGVETFAFAYYQYKPAGHNLTSEWDYLYNKAHNEYLNYLTTTGLFGIGTYLWMIGLFLFVTSKYLWKKHTFEFADFLILALLSGYISILISNFFGFSTVVINLFFFLTPAFVFILAKMLDTEKTLSFPAHAHQTKGSQSVNPYQWTAISIIVILAISLLMGLIRSWYADTAYALGANLNRVGSYQEAYPQLIESVNIEPNEPVFQDELAINLGTLATALYMQQDATNGAQFAQNAITLNNQVVTNHPNNVVYWKNRVRLFYTLAQGDPEHAQQYYDEAMKAILAAQKLAPTDAKISYNVAILYHQIGQLDKAIETIEQTIVLKPNYRDAYLALGLFYNAKAMNENGEIVDEKMQQKAIETYEYVLKNISPNDTETEKTVKEWKNALQ